MFKEIIKDFEKAFELLNKARQVLIISHVRPDADTISANCAMKAILRTLGKKVLSVCADPVPDNCGFLNGSDEFVNDFDPNEFDLLISVDCGGEQRVGFQKVFNVGVPLINIDHHESNKSFGNVNIVCPKACSTCSILVKFFRFCEYEITPDIATSLLTGIYFDTGSLMHPNVTSYTFGAVSYLIRKGAKREIIVKNLFKTIPVDEMKLWGRILERARINEDGIVTSAATTRDYNEIGDELKNVSGVIDFLNSVSNSKFCILLSEDREKGEIKGSFRTKRDDLDVSKLAGMLGGGGHQKAAGFGVPGKIIEERIFKIVEK